MTERSLWRHADQVLTKAGALDQSRALRTLVDTAQGVVDAHRAVIEGVTPNHPNWCASDRDEYDARFSNWHAATRALKEALGV